MSDEVKRNHPTMTTTTRKPTVCVDFDGVIARHDDWKGIEHFGEPIEGAREFLVELSKFARIVVFTCRTNLELNSKECQARGWRTADYLAELVGRWLREHEMPFDEVYSGQGKPVASAYVDDRAVWCNPTKITSQASLCSFDMAMHHVKWLCRVVNPQTGAQNANNDAKLP